MCTWVSRNNGQCIGDNGRAHTGKEAETGAAVHRLSLLRGANKALISFVCARQFVITYARAFFVGRVDVNTLFPALRLSRFASDWLNLHKQNNNYVIIQF